MVRIMAMNMMGSDMIHCGFVKYATVMENISVERLVKLGLWRIRCRQEKMIRLNIALKAGSEFTEAVVNINMG